MLASSCAVLSILKVAMKSLGIKRLGTHTLASRCFVDSGLFIPYLLSLISAEVLPSTLMEARLSPLMLPSQLSLSEQEREQQEPTSVRGEKYFLLPFSRPVPEKSKGLLMVNIEAAWLLNTHPETESKLYLMLLAEKISLISMNRVSSGSDEVLGSKVAFVCEVERRKEPWYQWHTEKNLSPPPR